MSAQSFIEDSIEHFGKKGMHWGVRNDTSSSGGKTKLVHPDSVHHPMDDFWERLDKDEIYNGIRKASKGRSSSDIEFINRNLVNLGKTPMAQVHIHNAEARVHILKEDVNYFNQAIVAVQKHLNSLPPKERKDSFQNLELDDFKEMRDNSLKEIEAKESKIKTLDAKLQVRQAKFNAKLEKRRR